MNALRFLKKYIFFLFLFFIAFRAASQTDMDAIMMFKNNFCSGAVYNYSRWDKYWEGTHKRDNANLGTVSTRMLGIMGNYGITNQLNVLFGVPYVKTKASAGQLHGMQGLQDLSLWLKWMPVRRQFGKGVLSLFAIGGYSFPVSDYTPDFLPLSIGLHSKNMSLRGMADFQAGDWFVTASATYVQRSNIELDRESYFTTEMHYTREVKMPDAAQYNLRAGFRNGHWIIELVGPNWTTLGGFDITKNNMPFPSNRMNVTSAGINLKIEPEYLKGLSLIGGGNYTLAGRNMGQAAGIYGGLFYVINFSGGNKKSKDTKSK
jgi:hypothetical protein